MKAVKAIRYEKEIMYIKVNGEAFSEVLTLFGVHRRLLKAVKNFYNGTAACVSKLG